MHHEARRVSGGRFGRRLLQLLTLGLFALGNPLYLVGCSGSDSDSNSSSSDDQYEYDRDDMLAVASGLEMEGPYAVGEYSISVQFPFAGEHAARDAESDAPSGRLAPSFFARAHACGNRSFVAPAAACIDSTEMQLRAKLRVERGAEVVELEATGNMWVGSRILSFANFDFSADSLRLSFAWREDEGYRYSPTAVNDTAALDALFER